MSMNIGQPFLSNVIKKKSEENLPRNAWAETHEEGEEEPL